jgi:hypothetical protein
MSEAKVVRYSLKDGGLVDYYAGFLNKDDADALWETCRYRHDVHGDIDVNQKPSSSSSSPPPTSTTTITEPDNKRVSAVDTSIAAPTPTPAVAVAVAAVSIAVPWKHDSVVVGKRTVVEPRYTAFLGRETGLQYTYSQKTMTSSKWPVDVEAMKTRIEKVLSDKYRFNVVLLNWYTFHLHNTLTQHSILQCCNRFI